MTTVSTLHFPSASRNQVNVVTSEVMTAVQQHPSLGKSPKNGFWASPDLRTLGEIGIQLLPESEIALTTAKVTCPQHQAVPPGVPVLSPADCQCGPGYSPAADTCEPCRRGKYKAPKVKSSGGMAVLDFQAFLDYHLHPSSSISNF